MERGNLIAHMKLFILMLPLLILTACMTPETTGLQGLAGENEREAVIQRQMVVKKWGNNELRAQTVAGPLLVKNASLCGSQTGFWDGAVLLSVEDVNGEYRKAARAGGMATHPDVVGVVKGSPAARAGLHPNDRIVGLNGAAIKNHADLRRRLSQEGSTVTYKILRKEVVKNITVQRVKSCGYTVETDTEKEPNAYADGERIVVSGGMMGFVRSDSELAVVIGHELAHNLMKHINKKEINQTGGAAVGFLIDVLAASQGINTNGGFTRDIGGIAGGAHSVAFEQEADYIGLYLTARAGYDVSDAANFWRRMSVDLDESGISMGGDHPANAQRFVALEKTESEIAAKKRKGSKLWPDNVVIPEL